MIYRGCIMNRNQVTENVRRKLFAESMGRCMNPNCQAELLRDNGDIIEKAHIVPYCKNADNTFENLIILCPNCHTDFDKNAAFTPDEVRSWKKIRQQELDRLFSKKYKTFDELKNEVTPLLLENKMIYEKYYIGENKELWDKFENKILANNKKLKKLFEKNFDLIQSHREQRYSNLEYIYTFLVHVDEFELTRLDEEKKRQVLFPEEINSMFGINPVSERLLPSTEALEDLITKLNKEGKYEKVVIGIDRPYIQLRENGKVSRVFLDDTPRLRQLYFNYDCYERAKVRLESLNFVLRYMRRNSIYFTFSKYNNLREISVNGTKIIFIYEYCLSQVALRSLFPEEKSVVVNLHNWNGECCISKQAYDLSEEMNVTLLTMDKFYGYIHGIKNKR